jgi:predicted AAA+ superfamily ATPase
MIMSHEERMEVARQYVDKQLETMKKYGSDPKDISDQERQALAEEVASKLDAS